MNPSREENPACTFVFKKLLRKGQRVHKRKTNSDEDDEEDDSTVIKKNKKATISNPMIQSTSTKKLYVPSETETADDYRPPVVLFDSFKSTHSSVITGPQDMGATATLDIETDQNTDAQTIFERSQKIRDELKGKADDHVYRGINNYAEYIEKKDSILGNASSGLVRKGPIRAPTNIRSTVRWDYQPDICKDYKETGFCGFGDSCKFMHDRTDYKHGWQLEREMDEGTYGKSDERSYEISSDEDDLPFKCYLCRSSFTNPIITKCKHYFCEQCALKHYKKSHRCFVCGENTNGIFNPAKDLISRLTKCKEPQHEDTLSDG